MYSGPRRILIQGSVSEPVHATHGMPAGCGHAVDLLHAFLLKTLESAGAQVEVRKYVDDMVIVAKGPHFAVEVCQAYRRVHRSLTQAKMKVNLRKIVVLCNGAKAKRMAPQGNYQRPWSSKRVMTFKQAMIRVSSLGLPAVSKAHIAAIATSLYSVGLYGAEVGGMSVARMNDVRISAGKALGKGANLRRSCPLELMAYIGAVRTLLA
eukprot:5437239-Amphidinium_carterae.1